jgi:hypothetical protein
VKDDDPTARICYHCGYYDSDDSAFKENPTFWRKLMKEGFPRLVDWEPIEAPPVITPKRSTLSHHPVNEAEPPRWFCFVRGVMRRGASLGVI